MMKRAREKLDQKPTYIQQAVWDDMIKKWGDPEWKRKAEQAKKNRASEKGGSLHTGGSMSIAEHRRRMKIETGKDPTLLDVFKRTHTKKGSDDFVDQRSSAIYEEYLKLKEIATQQFDGKHSEGFQPMVDESTLLLQAIGGKNRKERYYGLGSLASCVGGSSSSMYTAAPPGFVPIK